MFFVIIPISIYNFGIYLILVLSNCNAIQSTDCHVRYFNKLSIYLSIYYLSSCRRKKIRNFPESNNLLSINVIIWMLSFVRYLWPAKKKLGTLFPYPIQKEKNDEAFLPPPFLNNIVQLVTYLYLYKTAIKKPNYKCLSCGLKDQHLIRSLNVPYLTRVSQNVFFCQ